MNVFEQINIHLINLYKKFDDYCCDHKISYSIECDEANEQSYLVSKNTSKDEIMALIKMVRDYINNNSKIHLEINPSTIQHQNGAPRKDGTLLQFSLKPIQERNMQFNKPDNFDSKLEKSLLEHVDISFAEPDVLLTHNSANHFSETDSIAEAVRKESQNLECYVNIMENSKDEKLIDLIEDIIDNHNNHIKKLNKLLESRARKESKK